MTVETFAHVLRVMSNDVISLHHFGEPTLHSKLPTLLSMAAERGVRTSLSTNGRGLTPAKLKLLHDAGLGTLRLHVDPFGVRLRDLNIPKGLEATEHRVLVAGDAPKKDLQSFAGYLDLPNEGRRGVSRCSFLHDTWRVVLWNGDVALCCNDVEGTGSDELCKSCDGYVFESPLDWGNYDGQADSKHRLKVLK